VDVNCFDKYKGPLLSMYVFDDFQEEMAPHTPMEIKQENTKE
jgi:hypothetical protein